MDVYIASDGLYTFEAGKTQLSWHEIPVYYDTCTVVFEKELWNIQSEFFISVFQIDVEYYKWDRVLELGRILYASVRQLIAFY